MRLRVILIILALVGGVIGLSLLARKSRPATEAHSDSPPPPAAAPTHGKPAPVASFAPADAAEPADTTTNWLRSLLEGELDLQLIPEQQAEFLRQHGTNIETLLATQNTNYIRLAAQLLPDDPRVQYAVLARASEADVISYFDRMKLQGEWRAILWLQNRDKLR